MTANTTNVVARVGSARIDGLKDRFKKQSETAEFRVLTVVWTALMLWGAAIATFGYPALIVVALTLVPVVFVCLLLITVGK